MNNIETTNLKDNINLLPQIMDLIYEEWGQNFHTTKEHKLEKIKTAIKNNDRYPQIFALLLKDTLIGSFIIRENDLEGSNLNPWLACVVIKKEFRGKGYGNTLLNNILTTIKKMKINNIYLTTTHIGFYEKIGFKFIKHVDKDGEKNRLYELTL